MSNPAFSDERNQVEEAVKKPVIPVLSRRRGRPKGVKNGKAGIKRWKPNRWLPKYDAIVRLHATGFYTYAKLAEQFNLTEVHVGQICRTPQAEAIRRDIRFHIQQQHKQEVVERFGNIESKAMERVVEFFEDDRHFEDNPFAVVDRAMKFIDKKKRPAASYNDDEEAQININGDITINNNLTQNAILDIRDGLEKLQEIEVQHQDVKGDVISPVPDDGRMKDKDD